MKKTKLFLVLSLSLLYVKNSYSAGTFSARHLQRLNHPVNTKIKDQNLEIRLEGTKEKKKWDGFYSVDARLYPGQKNNTLLSFSEFYIQRNFRNASLTAGRKILEWNPDEKFWGLGVLNANRGFSYMDFNRDGINALHFETRVGSFGFHVFASPMHIPQLNPTFKIENKQVTAANEWSALPFKEVNFNGTSIPLYFELEKIKLSEFLLNTSIGINTSYHWEDGKAQIYGTYKPENLPRVVATGIYDPLSEAADVRAAAFTNHHLVWGGNISQKIKFATVVAGMIVDHPDVGKKDSFEFEAMKIVPTYKRRTYVHASINFANPVYNLSLNYMKTFEGPTGKGNAFSKKSLWKQAVGAKINYAATSKFHIMAFAKYDLSLKDSLMALSMDYDLTKHLNVSMGIETVDAPESLSFWSPFKTNDSVTSELKYKF
jgi:hypothetical protein